MATEVEAENVVVLDGDLPPLTLDNLTGQEVPPAPPLEVVEEVTDSAVEIAEIEAGEAIAIAQINADAMVAVEEEITARVLGDAERENQWQELMTNMGTLHQRVEDLALRLDHLSTPPTLPEPEAEIVTEDSVTEPGPLSIPQSIADLTSSTPMGAIGESVAESLAAENVEPARRRRRAI